MFGVGMTAFLGWILLISASYATSSVPDLLSSPLPLVMGQLFLDTLGKHGMLAIWSAIIVVQVRKLSNFSAKVSEHYLQFVTGAAQGVDASRVVFAFARDKALPGSRWWRKLNSRTQTPVNAVWLVMVIAAFCGLLGFSAAALTSLAGFVLVHCKYDD